jgi:hypothetical protein
MLSAGVFVPGLWRKDFGRTARLAAASDEPEDHDDYHDQQAELDESDHSRSLTPRERTSVRGSPALVKSNDDSGHELSQYP